MYLKTPIFWEKLFVKAQEKNTRAEISGDIQTRLFELQPAEELVLKNTTPYFYAQDQFRVIKSTGMQLSAEQRPHTTTGEQSDCP